MAAVISASEFERLDKLLNDPAMENDDAAQLLKNSPELRAEAEQRMQEFGEELARTQSAVAARKAVELTQGPGVAISEIAAGTQEILYGGAVFAIDTVKGLLPADGEASKKAVEMRTAVIKQRQEAEASHRRALEEQGITPENFPVAIGAGRFTGQVMPFMVAPAGLSTYWRTIGYNGVLGGVAGGIFDTEANNFRERLGSMTIGTLAGTVLSAGLYGPQAFRAYGARKLQRSLETDLAKANIALEKEVQRITGKDYTLNLGQITANPFIVGLVTGSAKAQARAAQNAQMNTLIEFFETRAKRHSLDGNIDDIAEGMNATVKDINGKLQKRASANFADGIEKVVVQFGEDIIMPGRHYLSEVQRLIAEYSNPLLGGSVPPAFLVKQARDLDLAVYPAINKTIKRLRPKRKPEDPDEFDDFIQLTDKRTGEVINEFPAAQRTQAANAMENYNTVNGGLNVEQSGELLRQFRRIASGEVPVFKSAAPGSNTNLSLALKKAMLEEMEQNTSNPIAIDAINKVRNAYQFDQGQIRHINNRLVAAMFGVEDVSAIDPQAAFQRLVTRSPKAQREMAKILEDTHPELLDDIRAEQIRQWVNNSFVPSAPTSVTPYSPVFLAEQLAGKTGQVGGAAKGLFSAAEQQHFKKMGEALRTMNETYLSVFPEAATSMVRDASINIVSRSPEFFARWMTGLLVQGKNVERMLMDPAFRESVIQVANKGLGNKTAQSAILYMVLTAAEWQGQDRDEERQRILEEKSVRGPGE
jgi:hypothetical protein